MSGSEASGGSRTSHEEERSVIEARRGGRRVPTVLYVEDEEMDRFFMERAFRREDVGASLRMVQDGRSAIDYLSGAGSYSDRQKHPFPGLVFLDLNLPEVHGFEVLQWIRAQPECGKLPVVIFSSSERHEDQARAKELGADEFMKKPGSGVLFQEVVRKVSRLWLSGVEEDGPRSEGSLPGSGG